jgi:hypothetical protein
MSEQKPPPESPAGSPAAAELGGLAELPELRSALARFERGDFLGTRRAIQEILAAHPGPEVAEAARRLAARLEADPWGVGAGLFALALLALVTGIYVF